MSLAELAALLSGVATIGGLTLMSHSKLWAFKDGFRTYTEGNVAAILYGLSLLTTVMAMVQFVLLMGWADIASTIVPPKLWQWWRIGLSAYFILVLTVIWRFRLLRLRTPAPLDRLW